MKAKITVHGNGSVTIAHDDLYGSGVRHEETYFCREIGGYVRTIDDKGAYPQVLKIGGGGSTLVSASREALPALIRAEHRKARVLAKKYLTN